MVKMVKFKLISIPIYDVNTSEDLKYLFDMLYSSEAGHLLLDTAGMAPVAGELFDAINGAWYTWEGDGQNAAISFASTIPFVYASMAKNVGKVIKLTDGNLSVVRFSEKATKELGEVFKKLDFDYSSFKILDEDLTDQSFAKQIAENPKLIESWKILQETNLRKNISWLQKVQSFQNNNLNISLVESNTFKIFRKDEEIAKIIGESLQIKIPYGDGWAKQSTDVLAVNTLKKIEETKKVYRLGRLDKSQAGEAQFWSPENPFDYENIWDYADKYGIPEENLLGDNVFFEIGLIDEGVPKITREAPSFGSNFGGAIEVVVPYNSLRLEVFNIINFQK